MVTTDISQLTAECNTWRANMRNYREEFTQYKNRLQEVATRQLSNNALQEIEHFQNQFHIQLINIHDLKQAIKEHERKTSWDISTDKPIGDADWAKHEELFDRYQQLDHTLSELKEDFNRFVQRMNA
jgi:hypothetical protein